MEEKEMFELQCLALRKDSKMYKDRTEAILQQMEEVAIERDQAMAAREELHAQQARSLQEKDRLRRRVRELDEKADELQLQLFQREGQLLAAEGRLRRQLEMRVPSSDLEDSSPRNSEEDLEEDSQLSDKGGPANEDSLEQPFAALQKERLSPTSSEASGSNREALEREQRERRRLKESFENYRRWALPVPGRWGPQCPGISALTCQGFRVFSRKRALRKVLPSSRQGEVDWGNTTGSDNTDTEGS
ncbi:hypothetical protein MC885_006562 [Smutsia gigantea]|nr:hypothetical protein MC885_006562 [Smutsia gigantea]